MSVGLVIKAEANFYSVVLDQQNYLCTVRANLKKAGSIPKVGDRVRLDGLEHERPAVCEILTRRNELKKPSIANVDQVLLVMSCHEPDFNPILVDRLLLSVLYEGLSPVICISKCDFISEDLKEILTEEYGGFPLFFISTETGEGFDELKAYLSDKVSVLAGASGVGKSTLINYLNPDCELSTGIVNQKMGMGKHTTRHVSLHRIDRSDKSGWLADSPGFSNCHLPPLDRAELAEMYPEFLPHIPDCAFSDCLHRDEINCAVQAHYDDSIRYGNYLKLLAEIEVMYRDRTYGESRVESKTKKAVGKNQQHQMLKLGTVGRARSRRTQNQDYIQVQKWNNLDMDMLDEMDLDEWRI